MRVWWRMFRVSWWWGYEGGRFANAIVGAYTMFAYMIKQRRKVLAGREVRKE